MQAPVSGSNCGSLECSPEELTPRRSLQDTSRLRNRFVAGRNDVGRSEKWAGWGDEFGERKPSLEGHAF
jgi:hypothetical protein